MSAQVSENHRPFTPEMIDLDAPEIPEGLSDAEYGEVLRRLSQASVDRHFDAFADIDWDHPDFAVRHDDPRWVLPEVDPLGGSAWYKSQPLEKQIAMGLWRQANIFKVGWQFENILIRGIMQHVFSLRNGAPEYRYLMHEATEECHHTQMFQEAVNRIGIDVSGMPLWIRAISPALPLVANRLPVAFFIGVLAGEEPIDHTQKAILRSRDESHPMMGRIMEIHVAEEARHISFAHEYVKRNAPRLGPVSRFAAALAFPVIMRVLGDAILVPPKEFRRTFGVPDELMDELYWDSPASQKMLGDTFADVRMLAEESGLMNPLSRRLWKKLGMWGRRPARYRSEPPVKFAA
ncbi:AurF N-oxygenase family protein [Nocardioides alkalitolerans]|uniref:AurF N-oxygenase family protein n=1 Tax=Nocardioides alkalitolerans TaxID=281714 RepID=UPI00041F733A|nr:diiron oxygenase [Nocardioides alkalitolerans]